MIIGIEIHLQPVVDIFDQRISQGDGVNGSIVAIVEIDDVERTRPNRLQGDPTAPLHETIVIQYIRHSRGLHPACPGNLSLPRGGTRNRAR